MKNSEPRLSTQEARAVMLAAQGLLRRPDRPATKRSVLETIRRMGALQIDTIHVVARSPYLVLRSRLGDYEPRWLDELLAEGRLFEYWSHAACFLPVEDYPLYRRRMISPGELGWKYSHKWVTSHREEVEKVLRAVRERGGVRSADFAREDGERGGWWEWKPEKRALEMLLTAGELMIARRQNFQRVYDLRERVLPSWDDSRLPAEDEAARALVLKAVRALGVTAARWVADYFRTDRRETESLTMRMGEEGALLRVGVEGWAGDAYVHPDNRGLIGAARAGRLRPTLTTLLSPFDPLVWDRARARAVFDFDYTLECYTPAHKRRYGYFTLPVLHRGSLVGRLDPKAHRREGVFEVKALHLEPGVATSEELVSSLASALRDCAAWHRTPEVIVRRTEPRRLAALLRRDLKGINPEAG